MKAPDALVRAVAASALAATLGLAWAGDAGQGAASPDAGAPPDVTEAPQAAPPGDPQPPAAATAAPSSPAPGPSDGRAAGTPVPAAPGTAASAAPIAPPAAVAPMPDAPQVTSGNEAGAPVTAAGVSAAEPSPARTAAETSTAAGAPPAPGASPRASLLPLAQPLWSELSEAQRQVLEPFASQWNALPASEKRAWADLALRFPKMKPEQRKRVERRIVEWAALTPQQRRVARENYRLAQQRSNERLVAEWEAYQAMTPEQRSVLVSAGSTPSNTAARSAAGPTGLARVAYQPLPRRTQATVAGTAGAGTPAPGAAPGAPQAPGR